MGYRGPRGKGTLSWGKARLCRKGGAFQTESSAFGLKTELWMQNELEARTRFALVYRVLQTLA